MVEFDILFGSGIDKLGCLLDAAESCGIVERKGSWYNKGELRIAQGRRSSIEYLRANPTLSEELEAEVRSELKNKSAKGFDKVVNQFDGSEEEGEENEIFSE